jgi:hypothetical protein
VILRCLIVQEQQRVRRGGLRVGDGAVGDYPLDVRAAAPGIRTTLELPLPTGRGTYGGPSGG